MKPVIKMGLDKKDLDAFLKDLEVIALPAKKKREILIRTLQMIKRTAVSNAANQREPTGTSWKKRKKGTAKMLRRIAKLANSKAEHEGKGRLFYRHDSTGRIATEHQEGIDRLHKKSDKQSITKEGKPSDPATARQAKKLRDLGYTVAGATKKDGSKRQRRPGIREIQSSLSRARASLIIRKLEEKYGTGIKKGLTQWIIPTVKRSFLDTREEETAKILLAEIQKYTKKQ